MTQAEQDIMRYFRRYRVGVNEMVFFNNSLTCASSTKFQIAMASLIRDGLVIKERRKNAYSLTDTGFAASLST